MFGLLLALAVHAAILQSAQASCDISDLGCIAKDLKASLHVNPGSFESEYQQFAEMIAPVLLLAHGGDFEASLRSLIFEPTPCTQGLMEHIAANIIPPTPSDNPPACTRHRRWIASAANIAPDSADL